MTAPITTQQLTLEAACKNPGDPTPLYYPILHLGDITDPVVGSQTLIDLEAPEGTSDPGSATVTLEILIPEPSKFAALSIKRSTVVVADWETGKDTLLWTMSESEGVMSKDYGVTFTLQFSGSDDKEAEDGDWEWASGIWTLDPIVRIRRASYSIRTS